MVRPTEERVREIRADATGVVPSDRGRLDATHARFTRLVESERSHVYRLICRLLGRSDGAEDVLQDVFTRAWLHWSELEEHPRPGAWLRRVALNACRQRMRRWQLWRTWFRQARPADEADPSDADGAERVRLGIAQLGHADREVLVLRYLEALSIEDICQLLRHDRSVIDARLSRARKRLGQVLGDDHA